MGDRELNLRYAHAVSDHPLRDFGDSESIQLERRELERRAYGPTSTAQEENEALVARRSLDELDRFSSPSPGSATELTSSDPKTSGGHAAASEAGGDGEIPHRHPRAPTRRIVPLIAVAVGALVVGGLVGRFTGATPVMPSHLSTPPRVLSASIVVSTPLQDRKASTIGKTWFSRPQASSDRFLFYNAPDSLYQPATVRLVATASALGSVYIAKRTKPGSGVCLILWGHKAVDGSQPGAMSCASTNTFLAHGIDLKLDGFGSAVARWTTTAITLTEQD